MQQTQTDDRPTERVTTLIPPWLYRRIQIDARRRMISLSAVVREQLAIRYRDKESTGEEHS